MSPAERAARDAADKDAWIAEQLAASFDHTAHQRDVVERVLLPAQRLAS